MTIVISGRGQEGKKQRKNKIRRRERGKERSSNRWKNKKLMIRMADMRENTRRMMGKSRKLKQNKLGKKRKK